MPKKTQPANKYISSSAWYSCLARTPTLQLNRKGKEINTCSETVKFKEHQMKDINNIRSTFHC